MHLSSKEGVKMKKFSRILLVFLPIILGLYTKDISACSATNSNNDARCESNCSVDETPYCRDATGSNQPTCECIKNSVNLISSDKTPIDLQNLSDLETLNFLTVGATIIPPSSKTTSNVLDLIRAKIATLPPVDTVVSIYDGWIPNPDRGCSLVNRGGEWVDRCLGPEKIQHWHNETKVLPLTISKVDIQSKNEVVLGKPIFTKLPYDLTSENYFITNCTAKLKIPQGKKTFTLATSRQVQSQITKGLSQVSGDSLDIDLKDIVPGLSVNGKIRQEQSRTMVEVKTDTIGQTITRVTEIPFPELPQKSGVIATIFVYKVDINIPFNVEVVINGNFDTNNKYNTLDQVLSEKERTFKISGTIYTSDASQLNYTLSDAPKSACTDGSAGLIIAPITPAEAKRLKAAKKNKSK